MVFNSAVFVVFYLVVLALYWSFSRFKHALQIQNTFLLAASLFFYGYWDWLLLVLIISSTVVDYFAALGMGNARSARVKKIILTFSVIFNLGLLGFFKYADFFIASFVDAARSINPALFPEGSHSLLLHLILPVGISFYTFQTMSYTIDVYRGDIHAEKSFLNFALFVSFFPQLVAGPIERAGKLLPQLKSPRVMTEQFFIEGAWMLLLGFFLKVYVADTLGPEVDRIFFPSADVYRQHADQISSLSTLHVLFATYAFSFQIYCDFAGYSFIALGTARLLGIDLSLNFNAPELSQNPFDLWKRWHISLAHWLRDYIFIPLGGSKLGGARTLINVAIVFLLSGLWHGASWTFVLWGVLHGMWMIVYGASRKHLYKLPASLPTFVYKIDAATKMLVVFTLFSLSGILFRAFDLNQSVLMFKSFITNWNVPETSLFPNSWGFFSTIIRPISLLLMLDIASYHYKNTYWIHDRSVVTRVIVYSILFYAVVITGVFGRDVIYFAF